MTKEQLRAAGAIYFENIQEGLSEYSSEIRKMNQEQAYEQLFQIWSAQGFQGAFADFYYYRLDVEAKKKVEESLSAEDRQYLMRNSADPEEIIFPLNTELLRIITKLNNSGMLFSTVYFTGEERSTWWGNYNGEYVVFQDGEHIEMIEVKENKKEYLDLLLLADEQESMVDRYLERGTMYALKDHGIKAICVVTDEGDGILEIKNIATEPEYQRQGYGKRLINFIVNRYRESHEILQVGTGDSPLTIPFYEGCGFHRSHIIKNFFVDNYDHPIVEGGKQLVDMVYLRREL